MPADPLVTRLLRRYPGLTVEDAAQYAAEIRLALPLAADDARWEVLAARLRTDGYDAPEQVASEREDDEGHRQAWDPSDEGRAVAGVFARLGLRVERERRVRRVRPGVLWRLFRRLVRHLPPNERQVVLRRWGRWFAGGEPEEFRAVARATGVALGTAWNIEDRAKARLRRLLQLEQAGWKPPEPEQTSWLDPPETPPPDPEPFSPQGVRPSASDADGDQLRLY